jgi:hypothetical protein
VEESKVKVIIPQKQKPVDIKKPEPPQLLPGQDDDSDDEILDVEMIIERQSSAKEDAPIDYLGMDEEKKKKPVAAK